MSFEFVVTINDVYQMQGGLTQAAAFIISRYGSLDDGINAGARIVPEWLSLPPKPPARPSPPPRTPLPRAPLRTGAPA